MSKISLPRLLSVREVSEATGIPKSTLYDLVASRELPVYRLGRSLRLDPEDVTRFLEGCKG